MQAKWFILWAAVAGQAVTAAETFTIDPANSSVGFKVRHFFSRVTGRFSDVKCARTLDEQAPRTRPSK
jgi:polyisoprenoid-binding protein YceI